MVSSLCQPPALWTSSGLRRRSATPSDAERRQAERIRAGVSLRGQLQFATYLAQRQQTPSLTFREHLRAVGGAIEE
jgi:hypothetical protein